MAKLLSTRTLDNIGYFDSLLNDVFRSSYVNQNVRTQPPANIVKSETGFQVDIAAPGLSRSDFNISVEDNILTVSVKSESKQEKQIKKEFDFLNFSRSFVLSKDTTADRISASYNSGILSLEIPVDSKNKAFSIKVE